MYNVIKQRKFAKTIEQLIQIFQKVHHRLAAPFVSHRIIIRKLMLE